MAAEPLGDFSELVIGGPSPNWSRMITRKRRTRTIHAERLVIVESGESVVPGYCGICNAERQMLSPEQAARLCGLSLRQLFRLVESSSLHFTETPDGLLVVCLESLVSILGNETPVEKRLHGRASS